MILNVGATLACGTGAGAVVVAAVLEGRAERVSILFFLFGNFTFIVTTTCVIYSLHFFWVMQKCIVDVPGGSLKIEWREDDCSCLHDCSCRGRYGSGESDSHVYMTSHV